MRRTLRLTRALVGKIPTTIPDPGPMAEIADVQNEDVQKQTLHDILATRPDREQFWVFAFGSLMWKPDFTFREERRARVIGWHRAFCIGPDTRYRGNPDSPGIMLSLDGGGTCDGVAFRLHEDDLQACLTGLIEREPPIPPEWVYAETDAGPIKALAFVCAPGGRGYIGDLAPEEIARRIAPAVGIFGSMADYILNTATHLEAMGIHDAGVWQMQEFVAAELERMA